MEQNTMKTRKVRDPFQRTVTGTVLHIIWRLILLVLILVMTFAIMGGISMGIIYNKAKTYIEQDVIPNANYSLEGQKLNQSSFIYAYNKETGEYEELRQLVATENRIWVDYKEIPQDIINATVAIEDKRFFEHNGVDWQSTIYACVNMFMGGSNRGGSTLTQQLIKNLTQKDEVTVRRKVTEIFTALEFEKHYSKEEILEWYLNAVYYGEGAYGVKSAAKVYFGKELQDLTIKECACIVGITNNPSMYDPYLHPEANERRTQIILSEMLSQGKITQAQYDEATVQELSFGSGDEEEETYVCENCGYTGTLDTFETEEDDVYRCPECNTELPYEAEKPNYYTYFEDQVIRDVISDLMEEYDYTYEIASQMVTTGGYIIYSTIDLDAQAAVDSVYQDLDNIPGTYSDQQLQSAIVVIDNETGDIVAMAGGVGEKEGYLTLNRATQSRLPTGSSIKPVTVYGPALEYGIITPGSAYEDSPYMQINGRNWPLNDSRSYSGWMTVNQGLMRSLNTIAVKVLADLTPQKSYEFATQKLGLYNLVEHETINGKEFSDIDYAPLALGQLTHGVTVREMTNAFAAFPNKGVFREARTYTKVVDSTGKVILDNTQESHVALSEHAAYYLTYMLQNAVRSGTGTVAYMKNAAVAGKTGTSSSNQDRWFSGYTPNYTAAVWCGYDEPEEIRLVNSKNPAGVLWKNVMTLLHEGIEYQDFEVPTDEPFVSCRVCSQTGLLAGEKCTEVTVRLFKSDIPTKTCNSHEELPVTICHPAGDASTQYAATDYCQEFYDLTHSVEFATLVASGKLNLTQALTPNTLEQVMMTVLMKADDKGKMPTNQQLLEQALEDAGIKNCSVHTAQALAELKSAIETAKNSSGTTEPPVTDPPDPTTPPETDPPTTDTVEETIDGAAPSALPPQNVFWSKRQRRGVGIRNK